MRFKKLGIIGAMKEEIDLFFSGMKDTRESVKAGITFIQGIFFGTSIVLCRSGVGKVNAAVCTQLLIDHFQVDAVVFTGVAGALQPDLNIGDVVISSECMHHDIDATALGFKQGEIPFNAVSVFPADLTLVQHAQEACGSLEGRQSLLGRILSGDQFIADREQVKRMHTDLSGACTEMEGAAVAQVCHMNSIPYVVIRSMSDKADGSANVNFEQFTVQAAENSYRIVEQMVKKK